MRAADGEAAYHGGRGVGVRGPLDRVPEMSRALAVVVLVLAFLVPFEVGPAGAAVATPTTTTLTISPSSPAVVGQQLTFTVHVTSSTGAIPVGSVTINTAGCTNPASQFGDLDASGNAVITAPASGPSTTTTPPASTPS